MRCCLQEMEARASRVRCVVRILTGVRSSQFLHSSWYPMFKASWFIHAHAANSDSISVFDKTLCFGCWLACDCVNCLYLCNLVAQCEKHCGSFKWYTAAVLVETSSYHINAIYQHIGDDFNCLFGVHELNFVQEHCMVIIWLKVVFVKCLVPVIHGKTRKTQAVMCFNMVCAVTIIDVGLEH